MDPQTDKERKYQFFKAIRDGRDEDALRLVADGLADPNWQHGLDGGTALHYAVRHLRLNLSLGLLANTEVSLEILDHEGKRAIDHFYSRDSFSEALLSEFERRGQTRPAQELFTPYLYEKKTSQPGEPILIPGLPYKVLGTPASDLVPVGATLTFLRLESIPIDKGENLYRLHFFDHDRDKKVFFDGDTLRTLEPILPVFPERVSATIRRAVEKLYVSDAQGRGEAVAFLAKQPEPWLFPLLWRVAQFDSEPYYVPGEDQGRVSERIKEIWANENPAAISFLTSGLKEGWLQDRSLARLFLAKAKNLFFLREVSVDLASVDDAVVRSALEEAEMIGKSELRPLVGPLLVHANPSVRIKAERVFGSLPV